MEEIMKNKKESLVLGEIIQKIAPRIGAKVLIEPVCGIVGQITFKSGHKSYFRYNTLDLNPVGSSDIAKDKDYADFFMKEMGYPTIPGSKTFFTDSWGKAVGASQRNIDAAFRHAQKLRFPVMVKPNSGSQGSNVALVHNKREFYRAIRAVFKHDRVALVQKPVHGQDYRLVVLDNEVISAYQRIPLNVMGNGKRTIAQLLKAKQREFTRAGRDTHIKHEDPRIRTKLLRQGLSSASVPKKGVRVYLLDNANLSTGGDSVDVTGNVHSLFKDAAVRLTKDMGLRLCGVDLMIDGDINQPPKIWWVIEINAAPGLDHYAKIGKAQATLVEKLYLKILKSIEK